MLGVRSPWQPPGTNRPVAPPVPAGVWRSGVDPGGVHTRLPGKPSGLGHVRVHFLLRDDHALFLLLRFWPQPEEDLELLGTTFWPTLRALRL